MTYEEALASVQRLGVECALPCTIRYFSDDLCKISAQHPNGYRIELQEWYDVDSLIARYPK